MAKGSLRVNGIIVDTDGEIKASTGDSIVIREDDGSAVITVDTNGKTSIGGPMDVGVDDTGHDVKFFGATSGAYMLWDESQDDEWLLLIYIKNNSPDEGIVIEDKTNPEKNLSHEFRNVDIFKASDTMVDSLTQLIARKRAKNNN